MPHADETFYKMKCGWSADPKVAALARFGPVDACLARDLFGQMIDYARRELTDGLVPKEAIGLIAYPLPADDAMRVAMQLADPGPYGPLCREDAASNALSILAYPKWNDTRAEVQARRQQGIKAARTRWEGANANGNAGSIAGSIAASTRDADGIHRARAQVHTEQEQEQENSRRAPARPRAREDAPAADVAADEFYNLDNQIVGILTGTGHVITRAEAGTIRAGLLAGKNPTDPARYVLKIIRTDAPAALRLITQAQPTRNQPPSSRTLCRRCSQPGHKADECPTLDGATGAGAEPADAKHWAEIARKGLAAAQAPPDPQTGVDQADDDDQADEHDDEFPF